MPLAPKPTTSPFLQKWTRAVHSEVDKCLAFGVEVDGIELISEKSMGPVMPNPMTFPLLSRSGCKKWSLQKWIRAVHSEVDKCLAFGVEVDGIELISEKSMGPVMPNPMTFPFLQKWMEEVVSSEVVSL